MAGMSFWVIGSVGVIFPIFRSDPSIRTLLLMWGSSTYIHAEKYHKMSKSKRSTIVY